MPVIIVVGDIFEVCLLFLLERFLIFWVSVGVVYLLSTSLFHDADVKVTYVKNNRYLIQILEIRKLHENRSYIVKI